MRNSAISRSLILFGLFFISKALVAQVQTLNSWEWIREIPFDQQLGYHTLKVATDKYGNIYVWSRPEGIPQSFQKGVIYKYSSDGTFLWHKQRECLQEVLISPNGDIIVAGTFTGNITVGGNTINGKGDRDFYIQKLDQNFSTIWTRSFVNPKDAYLNDIEINSQGELFFTGLFNDSLISSNITLLTDTQGFFLGKLDQNGNVKSIVKAPYVPNRKYYAGNSITASTNNSICVLGNTGVTPDLFVFDNQCNFIKYQMNFNGWARFDSNGNLLVLDGGTPGSLHLLEKFNGSNNLMWSNKAEHLWLSGKKALQLDDHEDIWMVGDAWIYLTKDPHIGDTLMLDTIQVACRGFSDILITQIDHLTGYHKNALIFGCEGYEYSTDMTLDGAGNIIIAGNGDHTHTGQKVCAGNLEITLDTSKRFIAKLKLTNNPYPISVSEFSKFQRISSVFPNPSNGICTITCPRPFKLTIFDAKGGLILETEAENSYTAGALNMSSGLYVFLVTTNTGLETHKVIVDRNE